ncbi:MAG: flagellar assembly protein FliW [Oscillospiraceae bacterium]|nr:flagellar assembly protein FliW [Oscillospiraceae bacterium]MBQ4311988.1 flagellar assembly protein FliW [Oscillospiraceae bacterium]MCR5168546.1 flagellar assembly protein FliW [Oscillospiraceae bacterium]
MSELIKVKTRDFDMIEIPENEILHFTQGIYAFDDYFRYVLLAPLGKNKFPMWLQCIDNENLCFIIFDPLECCTDYSVTLSDDEKEQLGVEKGCEDKVEFLVIAVVPDKYEDTTINLKSPIAVNTANNKAMQIIAPENYPIRFPLFKKGED